MYMAASLGLMSHEAAALYFHDLPLFTDTCAVPELHFDAVPPSGYSPPPPALFSGAGAAENEANIYTGGDGAAAGSHGGGGRGRMGFRTRSEVDVLDDGFKWRKYGKKAVKSSPNPRNYYRCSSEGCGVKKRVERDRDDPRNVVTTYDGVHNHATPGAGAAAFHHLSHSAPATWGAPPAGLAGSWSQVQSHPPPPAAAHSSESSYTNISY